MTTSTQFYFKFYIRKSQAIGFFWSISSSKIFTEYLGWLYKDQVDFVTSNQFLQDLILNPG
jgi:hypothetical protein